jgi:hypothetical protein
MSLSEMLSASARQPRLRCPLDYVGLSQSLHVHVRVGAWAPVRPAEGPAATQRVEINGAAQAHASVAICCGTFHTKRAAGLRENNG